MEEIWKKMLASFQLTDTIYESLIVGLIFTCFVWYMQYHWKRRKLYKMAAKINGPITLPFIGNAFYFIGSNSDTLNSINRIAKEFNSPVRVWLGQRLFLGIWEPNDMEIIMNSPHSLKKEELYKQAEIVVGTGLFTASVSKWKRHRKIIMPTFNQKILNDFVDVFSEQSEILLEQLKKEVGMGAFNIFHYISRCTLDIICETAMEITVNAQTTDSNYVKWANRAMELVFLRMFNICYHSDYIFNLTPLAKELKDITEKMHAFTGAVVKERRKAYQQKLMENRERPEALIEEEPSKRKTFLQQLIELSEEGAKFTDKELREEVDTFMIAGSDTTASMNSFTFIMLGMFPDIQNKVYQEVIDVLGPDRRVECKDLSKLNYMERVLKETMRLFPVGPVLVRAVTEDIILTKCTVPAGVSVVLGIMAMHRNSKVWSDPLKFDPDRFLPDQIAKRHPYSWLPFSGGPRNCVGPKYAFMAMKALLATVIRKYRFLTDYKSIEEIKLKADLMLKPVDGYKVSLELRE